MTQPTCSLFLPHHAHQQHVFSAANQLVPFVLTRYKQDCQPYMYVSSQSSSKTRHSKQKAAYSNPRTQSNETHGVSSMNHSAAIAHLPKHTQQSRQHGTYGLQHHCNHIVAFAVAFKVRQPTAPRVTTTNQIN